MSTAMSQPQSWTPIADNRARPGNRVPPFAPSSAELGVYAKYVGRVRENPSLPPRALILGSTPELRDLTISAGLEAHALDISPEMLVKFSALMEHAGSELDKRHLGDWRATEFPAGYFGLVFGDGSLMSLASREDNETVVGRCARSLSPGGYLVARNSCFVSDYDGYRDASALVGDYRAGKLTWNDLFMELRFFVFKDQAYNPANFQYDAGVTFRRIDELQAAGLLPDGEYKRINEFRNSIINTVYPEAEFVSMVGRHGFRLEETFHDGPELFFRHFFMLAFAR
ncbi:MAG: hypothetical protein UY92_C0001G0031 [Candidatus Magasanikbacteria bacterium GW2011_GWA2_56_11]|uniref:Methyltransferase domain-containing protein n=1 Tax=Candidatus Magasanikbacteria bacterium GW2011_GWA2_56_11 TaxID=1619044 RepID=A0A0G2ANU1_9BACT|nr:MAG: hypothetical protein UY92_C0001G0031 [Candidatus Magasanikbacteria bacterium GW2011_GWA2_56_11]